MAGKVIDKDMGYDRFVREINEAAAKDPHVTVGIHAADDARDDGVSNVDVGVFNEFGTEVPGGGEEHVPARPFLRPTMDKNKKKYDRMLEKGTGRWIDGTSTLEKELGRAGAVAKGDVQQAITKLRDPKNADATIAMKGSSNPLIDQGEMRASIDFEVKIK